MKTDDHVHRVGPAIELHVDPATGPFLSVDAARDYLRTLRDADGRLPSGGTRVLMHSGTHAPFIRDPARDSGDSWIMVTSHFSREFPQRI